MSGDRRYIIAKADLQRMRDAGMGQYRIARALGCDPSTVMYWLKKFKMPTSLKQPIHISTDQVMRAIADFQRRAAE